jgi:L-threonylcarbamoyladenylate synthase
MVLDGGPCINGVESTIIGFEGEEPVLYRLGAIHKKKSKWPLVQ